MSTRAPGNRTFSSGSHSVRVWLITVPLVVIGLALGLWFVGAVLASGYLTSIALSVLWFVVVGVLIVLIAKRRPGLTAPMRTTFLVVAAASAVGFYWTSIRDDRVDETVITGVAASRLPSTPQAAPGTPAAPPAAATNVEVARGGFQTRAHSTRGTAAVVELAEGGRKLTLTDFATDNGPDLRVYLVRGRVQSDGDVDDYVDLGRLKGNVGNQQYTVPEGIDLSADTTVVIWCRAFSVNFGQADLRAS